MFDIGRLRDGETIVISGAAGSVGLVSSSFGANSILIDGRTV